MAHIFHDENHFDFAIVGGGCLGASTALALIRQWPNARIIWFEDTDPRTASKDKSKIIRSPYPDKDYVAFAEKALNLWQTECLYSEYYHHTGWVQVVTEGSHATLIKGPNDRTISAEEMQKMVGSQGKPKLEAGEELRFNDNIGYADFDLAVEAVAVKASKLGVRREEIDITRLIVESGVCLGVEVDDYRIVAKATIVAAGPWTPRLLERSKVEFPADFFTIAGVRVATMDLKEKDFDELKFMPILVAESGEIVPSRRHKVLKITSTSSFRIEHPEELKISKTFHIQQNRALLEKLLPQFAGRQLDWWICPDLMTPYQHPLVDEVPGTSQLYLVVGGSYHSAKFLPNIGDMVVRRLRRQNGSDTLEDRLLKRWGWDRSTEKVAVHGNVIPAT